MTAEFVETACAPLYAPRISVSTKSGIPGWRARFRRQDHFHLGLGAGDIVVDDDVVAFRPMPSLAMAIWRATASVAPQTAFLNDFLIKHYFHIYQRAS